MSDIPRSKKSKAMGKQYLRQFMFKKMKSQDNSCSSTLPVDSGTPSSNCCDLAILKPWLRHCPGVVLLI